ncbi:MAG: twin-arginine translocase subunit TatC [Flavobacteriales bacterium]|nr:twin-arginine translocase subunit TatC [Flavobacteriales bacterium]|tara:strand:+ start:804 stop:1589 length:786 start_codon:yes stop_codon:yes gene_type:complete
MKVEKKKKKESFLSHLEDLRWHLTRSVIAVIVGTFITFLNKEFLFDQIIFACKENSFPTYVFLCSISDKLCIQDMPFILMNIEMTGQFTMHILVSFVTGFIIAFPYVLFEIWLFVSPAMYKSEKQNSILFFLFSCCLFIIGILFAYYVIVPFSINFLSSYSISGEVTNKIHFISFIKTITKIILTTGLLFQLPVVIYFLTKFNLVTAKQLKQYRRHAFVVILIIASILTPPDVFSQILIGLPIFMLYEFSIFISRLMSSKS